MKCILLSKIACYSVSKTGFHFSIYCKTTYKHIIERRVTQYIKAGVLCKRYLFNKCLLSGKLSPY